MTSGTGRRIDRYWRTLATAISFFAFGAGGVILGVFAFPLLLLPEARRRLIARRMVQRSFALHVELMRRLGVLTYEIVGRERLARDGLLILANHPTLIDVVVLVSLLPNATCVVKRAVARNPFMRGPVQAAGYVSNDDGAGLVEDCVAAVRGGSSLVLFPEGTRSVPGQPPRLQRGAANIAVRGGLDITPVRITCTPPTLTKGEKWYRVPSQRFHIQVEICQDLSIGSILGSDGPIPTDAKAVRRVNDYLTDYFDFVGDSTVQDLEHEIKELIISSLSLESISAGDIDSRAPLFVEGLGLDSIDALELGLALQKKYGVSLAADSEETRRYFSSVNALAEFVSANRA